MVSDVVAWERMVQRLGRVNRRGEREAQVIVVPSLPSKKELQAVDKEVEDRNEQERAIVARLELIRASQRALEQLPRRGDALDASPGALTSLKRRAESDAELATLLASATTKAPLHPALSRALVESWSMTSLEEHSGRPEVDPWVRGWVEHEPQTTIVWRKHLPISSEGDGVKTKMVEAFFEAAAPHLLEQLETETYHAVDWLWTRLEAIPERPKLEHSAKDERPAVAGLTRERVVAFLRSRDGSITSLRGTLLAEHRRGPKAAREQLERDLRDATLIVDARLAGLCAGLLDETSDAPVSDVAEVRSDLPFRVRSVGVDEARHKDWFEELRVTTDSTEEGEARRLLVVERPRNRSANTEEGRSTSRAQTLTDHQSWAEREATTIASRLGLSSPYAQVLALAARLHDEGKQAQVWQRAFNAPKDAVYAKTVGRPNIALLDGYRHELGSLPYAMKDARVKELEPELRDLCLHLIAAHHGFARPVIRTSGCEDAPPSALVERAQQIALRFSDLERRWGPWGLAWWESLLRAADQEASRKNDEAGELGHG
jgi:CRISPR-associated endonuclease/helicase Cas3